MEEKTIRTPYGQVREGVLERLQSSFDTRELLTAVDNIDQFCGQWVEELRSDLLRLHAMVHTVVNGAPLTQPMAKETLAEMAASLSMAFDEAGQSFLRISRLLDRISELGPE